MRQRCSDANTPYHDRTRRRTNGRGDLSLHRRTERWPDRAGKARKEGVGQERDWRHRSENPGPRAQPHSARPRRGSSAGPELPANSRATRRFPLGGERAAVGRPHCARRQRGTPDRKSVVEGKSVSVRVDLGGGRFIKKKKKK